MITLMPPKAYVPTFLRGLQEATIAANSQEQEFIFEEEKPCETHEEEVAEEAALLEAEIHSQQPEEDMGQVEEGASSEVEMMESAEEMVPPEDTMCFSGLKELFLEDKNEHFEEPSSSSGDKSVDSITVAPSSV
jgi:hypothetical protein